MRYLPSTAAAVLCLAAPAFAEFSWSANGMMNVWAQAYGEPQTSQDLATGVGSITATAGSQGFLSDASGRCESTITYLSGSSIDTVLYGSGNAGSAFGTSIGHGGFSQYFTLTTSEAVTLNLQIYGSTSLGSTLQGSYAWWSVKVNGVSYGESWTPGHSISLGAGVHQVYLSGQAHIIGGSMSGFGGSYLHAAMSVTAVPAPGAAWVLAGALGICGTRRRRFPLSTARPPLRIRFPAESRGLTLVETLVSIASGAIALALFSGAAMMLRQGSGEDISKAHMAALFQSHEQYAQSNSGKQWCAHLDDFGDTPNCGVYLSTHPCPPQQVLGTDANGGEWGYWLGGGSCGSLPGNCGNWAAYRPCSMNQVDGWFGSWRTINVRSFHDYVDGRFYDETFYAPNDTAAYAAAMPQFSNPAEFVYPPTQIVWPSYSMSMSAMWHPDVFRGPADGGFQQPQYFPAAYTRQNLAAAAFPELKSLMFEMRWNQSPPAGSHLYNASASSRPVTLFYDGRVSNIPNLVAIIDDARVWQQANDNLWCRNSPGGSAGFYGALTLDPTLTSHSVLTTRGILGRDVLDTRCRVGGTELALLFGNWGGTAPDIVLDGTVNGYDLTRVLDCWGGCSE